MKKKSTHTLAQARVPEKAPAAAHAWWAPMLWLGVTLLLIRFGYLQWLTPYGLAPDEAQYWSWLQNLDFSYVTKPPLTTWAIGASTFLLGDTLIGVKFFALLSQLVVPLLGAALARELSIAAHKNTAGWWAFVLLNTLPLIAAGGLIMAPDVLLLPLWLAALLGLVKAFEVPESRALCWPRWLLIGALVGMAGLAKYSAALFFPLLFGLLLWQKPQWLKTPQIWAAGLLALALQAPVVYWNATNAWAGLHHLLWQAESGDSRHGGLGSLLEFLGSQALVLGPLGLGLIVLAWLWAAQQGKKLAPRHAAMLVFTLPIFGAFLGQTFFSKVQANWPLLATVPALPLAAAWLAAYSLKRWLAVLLSLGLALNLFLSLALYNTHLIRAVLPHKADPTKDLMGWAAMGELLGGALQRLENPIVLGVRYQTLAPLAFHTKPATDWFYWNAEGRRAVDYDDWLWPSTLPQRPVVLVKESPDFPLSVTQLFTECRPWHSFGTEQHGIMVRKLYTWLCWGYRPQQ